MDSFFSEKCFFMADIILRLIFPVKSDFCRRMILAYPFSDVGLSEELSPGKILLLAWGPGQYALEASAGMPVVKLNLLNFRRGRRGGVIRPIHEEMNALWFQADWTGPGPWALLAFTPNLSSSDLGHPLLTEWSHLGCIWTYY